MSGPKVSVYELSATERKLFYEQLEILKQTEINLQQVFKGMTNLQCEVETIKESVSQGENLAAQLNRPCKFSLILEQIEEIITKMQMFEKEYQRIKEAYRVDKSGYVQMSVAMHKERAEKLKALQNLNAEIGQQVRLVKTLQKQVLDEIKDIDDSLKEELQGKILGGFSVSFTTITREVKKEIAEESPDYEQLEQQKQEKLQKLKSYQDKIFEALVDISDTVGTPDRLSPKLAEKLSMIQRKAAEITSVDFIENYYAISVLPFVKECKQYIELLCKFDESYLRYEFLCEEAGLIAKKYAVTKENIELINEEIEKLEAADAEAQTKEFIENAINEAMKEMGYDLVGNREIIKKSGKKIRHGLYHFGEGTGVDITFSGNGQITMELGGFDNEDRLPDENEASRLVDDMQRFCGEYAALERLLEKKGVQRRNIQMLPPSIEYAQIFNTEDYEMTKPVQKLEAKKSQKVGGQVRHMK